MLTVPSLDLLKSHSAACLHVCRLQLFASGLQPDEDSDGEDDSSGQGGGVDKSIGISVHTIGHSIHKSRRQTVGGPPTRVDGSFRGWSGGTRVKSTLQGIYSFAFWEMGAL